VKHPKERWVSTEPVIANHDRFLAWKKLLANRRESLRITQRKARTLNLAIASEVLTSTVRTPWGKKARLSERWSSKDRFWRSKAIARDGSWNRAST
jgi:hypothetical protein